MFDVIRTIHPVGQGGFYTETIKDDKEKNTVVYDCGGNGISFMESYLDKYLHGDIHGNKMKIAAVFISHLHADHVNGLEYLLKNADVKYLILPQLTEELMWDAVTHNLLHTNEGDKGINDFILSLYGQNGFYRDTRIVQVEPSEPGTAINLEEDSGFDLLSSDTRMEVHPRTRFFFDTFPSWAYIPYNPPVKENGFYEYLKRRLNESDFTFRDLPKIIKGRVDRCKKIYRDYFGTDHNAYSMTLYSGLLHLERSEWIEKNRSSRHYLGDRWRQYYCVDTPNCLFTGDFEPSPFLPELITYYNPVWETIRSIQVPHHGSRLNYHPDLYQFALRGFISAGEKSRHHHPNIDTLINIKDKGCRPVVVTENLSTIQTYYYSIV